MKVSILTLTEQSSTPAAPAAGRVSAYADNTANPGLRFIDDSGANKMITPVHNASTVSQAIASTSRTFLAGSALAIPKNKLKIGSKMTWRFSVTKTAAGTAASTIDVCFGTNGSTSDTARISFTKPAGTAAADEAWFEIDVVVRSIGASGVAVGTMRLIHNLSTTGHAQIPAVVVTTVSAGFDMTVADLIAGVCFTAGASDSLAFEQVQGELVNS